MKAPISMCIITKDDPFLEQCVASFRDYVEEIVIVDTGSADPSMGKRLADKFEVFTACNDAEGRIQDFSMARQRSFDLASQPWVMWCDSDDIIEGADKLAAICARPLPPSPPDAMYLFPYEYMYDGNGKCIVRHYRERLFPNKESIYWINPVHEVVISKGPPGVHINMDEVVYKHKRQFNPKPTEPGRNLRILQKHYQSNPSDARTMYYLGLEYYTHHQWNESIQLLTQYVNISGWEDEKAMACLKLIDIYLFALNDIEAAEKWAFKTISIKENWCEGYFALCKIFFIYAQRNDPYTHRNYEKVAHFAGLGLACPPTKTLLFENPQDRNYHVHTMYNIALNYLGNVQGAYESCCKGLESNPSDSNLLFNKKICENHLSNVKVVEAVNVLTGNQELGQSERDLIVALLNKQVFVNQPSVVLKGLDIVFLLGDGMEIWNPETVKQTGIGGSELMAMEMAKRLAKNNTVRVYASCGEAKVYDGVQYLPTDQARGLTADVLIASRYGIFLGEDFCQAKLKLLWIHDVYAMQTNNELMLKADRILTLSNWHKQLVQQVHHLHPDHIITTRNGIDASSRFENKDVIKKMYRCINASSPDRSWPVLLDMWPQIRKQVPDAELHLYYGFDNWKKGAANDSAQLALIGRLEKQIDSLGSQGVVYHGRVNQEELALAYLTAGVWVYPTWFSETSCISAMEAQAAGCHLITSPIAALTETCQVNTTFIEGEWTSKEYQDNFIKATVKAIKHKAKAKAPDFSLDALAAEWEQMFVQLLEEKKTNPIIPYQPTKGYLSGGRGREEGGAPEKEKNQEIILKLNIACGPNVFPFPNWINYDKDDIIPYLKALGTMKDHSRMPAAQANLAKYIQEEGPIYFHQQDLKIGFPQHDDNSVDLIYLGQMMEHLNPLYESEKFLTECFRMLKIGGVVRITTPDLSLLIREFSANNLEQFAAQQPDWYKGALPEEQLCYLMYGSCGPDSTWNNYEGHQFLFTEKSLEKLLKKIGFRNINFHPLPRAECVDAGLEHSLCVEAIK